MGNTSETHKDKVTGVNDDGGVGDVDLKVHDGDVDVSLIPAVVPYCGHVRQPAGKAPRRSVQFS